MKLISKPLIYFLIIFISLTILFRLGLSNLLDLEKYRLVTIIAILYGFSLFISGWILGKAHGIKSLRFDMGIGFHMTGFISWSLVSLIWFWVGLNSAKESIHSVYLAMEIWGVFLLIHLAAFIYLRRNTIKGIYKSEIFD